MLEKRGMSAHLSALLLSLALASGPSSVIGAEKYVAYLSLADYTGAIAGLDLPANMGCEDYFKYLNGRGGVEGVKVRFIDVDTRYDIARGVSAFTRYRKTNKLLVVNAISPGVRKAIYPLIERDRLVSLAPGNGGYQAHIGRTFLWGVPHQDGFGAALDWMVEDWQNKGNSGKPAVGYMSWDNFYGKEALRGGTEYAQKIGVKVLLAELFPPGSIKHTVWLNRLAKGGVNYIYVGGVEPTQTNVIRDAHALGLTKKIQMVTDQWGLATKGGVEANSEELEGAVVTAYYIRGVDASKHSLTALWKVYRRHKPVSDIPPSYFAGQCWAMAFEAGLKIALKDVGYDRIDGQAMYKAYEKLTGMDVFQGIQGRCAYSPISRRGSREIKFYRVTGGKVVPITDWRIAPDTVSLHKW